MDRRGPQFRYKWFLLDFFSINFIPFGLLLTLEKVELSDVTILFIMVSNVLWFITSYLSALYIIQWTNTERFIRRTVQCFILYLFLILLFLFLYKEQSRLFASSSLGLFFIGIILTRVSIMYTGSYLQNSNRFNKNIVILRLQQSCKYLDKLF